MDKDSIYREIEELIERNEEALLEKVKKILQKADDKVLRKISRNYDDIRDMIGEIRW